MNTTTLFNPYLRTCRAPEEELPTRGTATPPAQEPPPAAVPPAEPPTNEPPADNTPPATPPAGATPPPAPEDAVDFSLDKEPPPAGEETPGSKQEEKPGDGKEKEKEPEYVLELPDDLEITDDFKNILKDQAKGSGLDGKAAGKYVSGVIKAMEEAERVNMAKDTRQLREDWGANFNANMDSVKAFAFKLREKSGLTPEDMGPLQSAKGYKLLFAVKQLVEEDTFVGGKTEQINDPQKEAHRMLTDPTHKYYDAMRDQTNPLFLEANRIYNNLVSTAP